MKTLDEALDLLEYYYTTVENSNYKNVKSNTFEQLLADEDTVEAAEETYGNRRDDSQHKKRIRTTLMSAFLRNGVVQRKTNWEFKKLFPLRTLDIESADILIGNNRMVLSF